jgi:hypothetical protein
MRRWRFSHLPRKGVERGGFDQCRDMTADFQVKFANGVTGDAGDQRIAGNVEPHQQARRRCLGDRGDLADEPIADRDAAGIAASGFSDAVVSATG